MDKVASKYIDHTTYVDVTGWSKEKVEKAAEIFFNSVDDAIGIDDISVDEDRGYVYLMFIGGEEVFVGCEFDLDLHNVYNEITEIQVFEG